MTFALIGSNRKWIKGCNQVRRIGEHLVKTAIVKLGIHPVSIIEPQE
jgi:hypothetical protein